MKESQLNIKDEFSPGGRVEIKETGETGEILNVIGISVRVLLDSGEQVDYDTSEVRVTTTHQSALAQLLKDDEPC